MDPDPYRVLGVSPSATPAEITHAFRAKLRALHPDTRHPDSTIAAPGDAQLRAVLAAYHVLRDSAVRADRDRTTKPADASNLQGPVEIPVTHRAQRQRPGTDRPLWAGPVRRHP